MPRIRGPLATRFWNRVNKNGPIVVPSLGRCWLWTGYLMPNGYGRLRTEVCNVAKQAHCIAFFLTYGHYPKPQGLHKCDVRACVRPSHIFEGTQRENIDDMLAKKRQVLGEKNGRAILKEKEVKEIRRQLLQGMRQIDLAAKYGVRQPAISSIKLNKAWTHV